jgi:MscS family membrane protein
VNASRPTVTPTLSPEVVEAMKTVEPVLTAVPASPAEEDNVGGLSTRKPMPTATPGFITTGVEKIFNLSEETSFLWLDQADWINLFISLLIVVLGYGFGTLLVYSILGRIVQRTQRKFDDQLFNAVRSDLRWIIVLLVLRFATLRLTFLNSEIKIFLSDIYFILLLLLVVRITWKIIGIFEDLYRVKSVQLDNEAQLAPVISWFVNFAKAIVILSAVTILLAHFGIDIFAYAAAIGITGFAVSLAAKDTIADVIAGMIILIDQPFRVGDRIEIQSENTWGDVAEIGLRTTRIRTRDNRMVIVPNSIIGKNQVINYTFPDPRYRIQTHVSIGYDNDVDTVRHILVNTVRQVEGVLEGKPVDALYIEMDNSAMIFRVRWWIESYADTRRMYDKVHSALQKALDEAGIKIPYDIFDVNFKAVERDNED